MKILISLSIYFIFLLYTCSNVPLPASFKKCNRKQEDFNDCLTAAISDALPQLTSPKPEVGLVSLEPLFLPAVVIEAGTKAVNFKQDYKNVKVSKLSQTSSLKAKMDFDKKTLVIDAVFPEVRMDFEYTIDGKIMMMPITGKGPGHIIIDNSQVKATFVMEEYEKKGKKHYKVIDSIVIYHKIDGLHVNYENLFNGDKLLGDNINNVINENWSEVFDDVKSGYEAAGSEALKAVFNGLLAKVPISELFGDA